MDGGRPLATAPTNDRPHGKPSTCRTAPSLGRSVYDNPVDVRSQNPAIDTVLAQRRRGRPRKDGSINTQSKIER